MASPQRAGLQPEKIILEILNQAHDNELAWRELVERLREKGWGSDADINDAIWKLVSEALLELTSKRMLRLPSHANGEKAEANR